MNSQNMVFAHQKQVADSLANKFHSIQVLTAEPFDRSETRPSHYAVMSSNWIPNHPIQNIFRFLRAVLPIIIRNRKSVVIFSHMTEVQSFLIAPVCRILQIKHFLWYAHASRSIYLFLAYPFLTGVLTSTKGSCPITGKKVKYLGQGVQLDLQGVEEAKIKVPPLRWYHVGRLDPAKNIGSIIEAIQVIRKRGWNLSLDLYGAPSSNDNIHYQEKLITTFNQPLEEGWLRFHGKVERKFLYKLSTGYDGFIHAFQGSLDKSLIEAVLCKKLIVTINKEFHNQFSSGGNLLSLESELLNLLELSKENLNQIIEKNFCIAQTHHSLENWTSKLVEILNETKE
jgi:glycosyltransferase involved in cell wall biosynthesis